MKIITQSNFTSFSKFFKNKHNETRNFFILWFFVHVSSKFCDMQMIKVWPEETRKKETQGKR